MCMICIFVCTYYICITRLSRSLLDLSILIFSLGFVLSRVITFPHYSYSIDWIWLLITYLRRGIDGICCLESRSLRDVLITTRRGANISLEEFPNTFSTHDYLPYHLFEVFFVADHTYPRVCRLHTTNRVLVVLAVLVISDLALEPQTAWNELPSRCTHHLYFLRLLC